MFEVTDRYAGRRPPTRWTMCKGPCEGLGWVPPAETCADCRGTGRRLDGPLADALDALYRVLEPLRFGWFWLREYRDLAGAWRGVKMIWRDHHPRPS